VNVSSPSSPSKAKASTALRIKSTWSPYTDTKSTLPVVAATVNASLLLVPRATKRSAAPVPSIVTVPANPKFRY